MGGAISAVAKFVAKATVNAAGAAVPVIGPSIATWINSKYAVGTVNLEGYKGVINPGVEIPEDKKIKLINTPAQLIQLIKDQPEAAKKAGLTVDMVKEEVAHAKEVSKAIGGKIKMPKAMVPRMDIPPNTMFTKPKGDKFAIGTKKLMPKEEEEPMEKPMKKQRKKSTKEPSPAQLAARKKFTEMVRAKAAQKAKAKK